ncbi:glycerate kinase [Streptomyces sp. HMX112]|uniref:glycerate kinase n=1 Tax=Streptomyces sp. HMX112 TaxID=3390850 RepID=UPI003A7F95C5
MITGGGAPDGRTPPGEVPGAVARRARQTGVPVLPLAGTPGDGAGSGGSGRLRADHARPRARLPARAEKARPRRGCLADLSGLASPGAVPRRVVVGRRCSAVAPSSASPSTAPDAAP